MWSYHIYSREASCEIDQAKARTISFLVRLGKYDLDPDLQSSNGLAGAQIGIFQKFANVSGDGLAGTHGSGSLNFWLCQCIRRGSGSRNFWIFQEVFGDGLAGTHGSGSRNSELSPRYSEMGWLAPMDPDLGNFQSSPSVYGDGPSGVCQRSTMCMYHRVVVSLHSWSSFWNDTYVVWWGI